ncbi:hypothetical protein Tco_1426448 [Tanacetum coccineum]
METFVPREPSMDTFLVSLRWRRSSRASDGDVPREPPMETFLESLRGRHSSSGVTTRILKKLVDSKNLLDRFPAALACSYYWNMDQNRYPVDTSLIHIESRKSPTAMLFDVDTGRISIRHRDTKEYHSECSVKITRIMRRTLRYHLCYLFVNSKRILELCPNEIYIDLF